MRSFWGDFAVIFKSYIHARFSSDIERAKMRDALLENGENLVDYFDLDNFKTYYKNIWKYFKRYIGFFDVNRKDIQLINNLNDVLNLLLYETPLEEWECQTCILFTKALLFTISTYDIHMYEGGFYSDDVLYIPLPHHAGTSDCIEIKIDEFEEWFNRFCEDYKKDTAF